MISVIAIFDVGKTNKKFFLIDERYSIVLEQSQSFAELTDEDGDACEDIHLLTQWVNTTLDEVLQQKRFEIKAINFSSYGASFVYIDSNGKVAAPLYNYLKSYPESLKQELYNKYGGASKISCETSSPVLGSLNSGMQLYRIMKEKPELYQQIQYALHLPQYLCYLVSSMACSDITSIGCHTQLWDFRQNKYHRWVIEEGLDSKLAPVLPSDKAFAIKINGTEMQIGTGLHDSSAALIPYLAVFSEPFILLSTGTWCISLNPFNKNPLTEEELKNDCLCYMEYQGKPVKASRLFAGYEHEQQVKRLAEHFDKPADYYKQVRYSDGIIEAIHKTGADEKPFAKWDLSRFSSYEEAYHLLMFTIIRQQKTSSNFVIHDSGVKRIFVDGGFGNNSIYMHLLALAFPDFEVYAATVAQATSMGAALAIHSYWNSLPVPSDMVKLKYYAAAGKQYSAG